MLPDISKYKNMICAVGESFELERIRNFVFNNAVNAGFDENESNKIALAVDEACSNLVKHAYNQDKTKRLCVQIELICGKFIINIFDEGNPFNPMEVPAPDMKEYFQQFKHGGLGIHIIRLIMDDISYTPSSPLYPHNRLSLSKSIH